MSFDGGGGGQPSEFDKKILALDGIDADTYTMQQYADQLKSIMETEYQPELDKLVKSMTAQMPAPPADFFELVSFMQVHRQAQENTLKNVWNYNDGSLGLAHAADKISKEYAGSDAFSNAKVGDVNKELGALPPAATTTDPGAAASNTGSTTSTDGR